MPGAYNISPNSYQRQALVSSQPNVLAAYLQVTMLKFPAITCVDAGSEEIGGKEAS